jgi:hypothetical protein
VISTKWAASTFPAAFERKIQEYPLVDPESHRDPWRYI